MQVDYPMTWGCPPSITFFPFLTDFEKSNSTELPEFSCRSNLGFNSLYVKLLGLFVYVDSAKVANRLSKLSKFQLLK